jgi:hypothetical protein
VVQLYESRQPQELLALFLLTGSYMCVFSEVASSSFQETAAFKIFLQEYLDEGKTKADAVEYWPYLSDESIKMYEEMSSQ